MLVLSRVKKKRLVYICDWLPPDFGAVGQYAMVSVGYVVG